MKKIMLSSLVLCLFLVSCGVESNVKDANINYKPIDIEPSGDTDINYDFMDEEESKDTTEKRMNLGDYQVIYVTAFPASRIDNSYVIEISESGTITSYLGR